MGYCKYPWPFGLVLTLFNRSCACLIGYISLLTLQINGHFLQFLFKSGIAGERNKINMPSVNQKRPSGETNSIVTHKILTQLLRK